VRAVEDMTNVAGLWLLVDDGSTRTSGLRAHARPFGLEIINGFTTGACARL